MRWRWNRHIKPNRDLQSYVNVAERLVSRIEELAQDDSIPIDKRLPLMKRTLDRLLTVRDLQRCDIYQRGAHREP